MAQPTRRVWLEVWKNFINSLKPRRINGDFKGEDYFGTKYFEIPANPSLGKRKPSRYFEPAKGRDFQQELPAEWEAWLRGRRIEIPSEEEIMKNLAIMQMKKHNAAKIEGGSSQALPATPAASSSFDAFPTRPEYEVVPGKQKKDSWEK